MADWRGIDSRYVPYTEQRANKCANCGLDTLTRLETHVSDGYSVSWECIPCKEVEKRLVIEAQIKHKKDHGIYDSHVMVLASLYTGRGQPETNVYKILFSEYKSDKLGAKRRAIFRHEYDLMVRSYYARIGTQPSDEYKIDAFDYAVKLARHRRLNHEQN